MAKLKSLGELEALRKSIINKRDPNKACITICNGTGCQAYGCKSVTAAFQEPPKTRRGVFPAVAPARYVTLSISESSGGLDSDASSRNGNCPK